MTDVTQVDLSAWLEETRVWVDARMEVLLGRVGGPKRLADAMHYALFGGGKRLRPAMVRLLCEHFGGRPEDAELPAVAIELVHTYSLVHDDLPCMDDDDLRRGRPTCHVRFDEATAVLAGDALLTAAFQLCASEPDDARAAAFGRILSVASGADGMVGGQVLDLYGDGAPIVSEAPASPELVRRIHQKKTAALFRGAAELGAAAAGVGGERAALAARFGETLGLAFQATDDLLDVTGDAATLGKTPGKDVALDRLTLVAALGMEGARREAEELTDAALELSGRLEGARGGLLDALTRYVLRRKA